MDVTGTCPELRGPAISVDGPMTISGGILTLVQGDSYDFRQIISSTVSENESGLKLLGRHIAHGATDDSAERYPPGKCHPGTREQIIKEILEWINDPDPSSDILWIYGAAGAGKSAIMQTIAELLRNQEEYKYRYAGSFFFARDVAGRDDAKRLFSTLAYQVAINLPGMRMPVNDAMDADQTLPTKSMNVQLKSLIVDPLARSSYFLHQPTIIIDGLDECRDSHTQREILSLISNAIANSRVPLRFLIASRPECWINDSFNKSPLFDLTKRVSMTDSRDAYKDIKKYLQDGFADIYSENSEIMSGIELPWPPVKIIDHLTRRASGQFIYASTVLKFVGSSSEFVDPQQQLRIISTPGPLQSQAFSALDQLYKRILSVYPARDVLLSVLGGLLSNATLKAIEIFMGIDPIDIKMVLRAIASLINFYPRDMKADSDDLEELYGLPATEYYFCHLSFREFLEDKKRSGPFSVDTQAVHDSFCDKFFESVKDILRGTRRPPKLTILECDQMWYIFALTMAPAVSPTKMRYHIDRLLVHILEFRNDDGRIFQVWPESPDDLLRPLIHVKELVSYLKDPWDVWEEDPFDIDQDKLDELDEEISALQDILIRQIWCNHNLSLHPIIPFMIDAHDCYFLDDLLHLPWIDYEAATTFLLKWAHFIDNHDIFANPPRLCYRLMDCFRDFLTSQSRGRIFHLEFRGSYTRTALALLKWFCRVRATTHEPSVRLSLRSRYLVYQVIKTFLGSSVYSDFQNPEDIYTTEIVVNTLSNCSWAHVDRDEEATYLCVASILNWISRYMNDPRSAPSSQKLIYIVVHIYHNILLPMFSQRFFSEFLVNDHGCLQSLSIQPPSSGTEILKVEDISQIMADLPAYCLEPYYFMEPSYKYLWKSVSAMTRTLIESKYHIPIPLSAWFTRVTEFYLQLFLKYQYHVLCDVPPSTCPEEDFNILLLHVHPTEKILLPLRAILYLRCKTDAPGKWWAPPGFGIFAMELLKKFDLDAQENLALASILKDVISSPNTRSKRILARFQLDTVEPLAAGNSYQRWPRHYPLWAQKPPNGRPGWFKGWNP